MVNRLLVVVRVEGRLGSVGSPVGVRWWASCQAARALRLLAPQWPSRPPGEKLDWSRWSWREKRVTNDE